MSISSKYIKSIGIIGSSQLALYLTQEARNYGYATYGLSDKKSDPAVTWFTKWIKGKMTKIEALQKISQFSSIVLFENKVHLNPQVVQKLNQNQFYPSLKLLAKTNDVWTLKELLYDFDIPQTSYLKINGKDDLDQGFLFFGRKAIIKNRFEMKNEPDTFIVRSQAQLNSFKLSHKGKESHFIMEEFLPTKTEHRLVMARNRKGQIAVYPLFTLNRSHGDYDQVTTDTAHKDFKPLVKKIEKLLNTLEYRGVITFNIFKNKNRLYVDDADCRPCNTGMITLDGFNINQFDLHIRAISNLDLPQIVQHSKKVSCKYLITGKFTQKSISNLKNGKIYWYGKKEKRAYRKLGHINFVT